MRLKSASTDCKSTVSIDQVRNFWGVEDFNREIGNHQEPPGDAERLAYRIQLVGTGVVHLPNDIADVALANAGFRGQLFLRPFSVLHERLDVGRDRFAD